MTGAILLKKRWRCNRSMEWELWARSSAVFDFVVLVRGIWWEPGRYLRRWSVEECGTDTIWLSLALGATLKKTEHFCRIKKANNGSKVSGCIEIQSWWEQHGDAYILSSELMDASRLWRVRWYIMYVIVPMCLELGIPQGWGEFDCVYEYVIPQCFSYLGVGTMCCHLQLWRRLGFVGVPDSRLQCQLVAWNKQKIRDHATALNNLANYLMPRN